MTNPNDPAFAHDGHKYLVDKKLLADLRPEIASKIAAIDHRYQGLTKREYFAAMAMQGMIPNYKTERSEDGDHALAFLAVKLADALIAELSK